MKIKWQQFLLMLFLLGVSIPSVAQKCRYAHEDEYYMAGRVPEENGRVVFSQTIQLPEKSKQEVYQDVLDWMTQRLEKNGNAKSRIVFTNPEEGVIVGTAEEWLVFHSMAMSLDRARMSYQISAFCEENTCVMRMEKIRYVYEQKHHYTAEKMITDAVALNKTQEKMYRGYAKWRNKTVDFAETLFTDAQNLMNANLLSETQNKQQVAEEVAKPMETVADLKDLPLTVFNPTEGTLVVCVGTEPFNMTTMTVDKGGSISRKEEQDWVTLRFAENQVFEVLKKSEAFQVKYYPNGAKEPSVLLECLNKGTLPNLDEHSFEGVVLKSHYRK